MFKAFVYTDHTLQAPNWVKSTYLYNEIKYLKLRLSVKFLIISLVPGAEEKKNINFLKNLHPKELNNYKNSYRG